MANNSAIVNSSSGSFQQPNSAHHCKECGLYFDSGKSLEVHTQYHKENLLNKWANQAAAAAGTQHHDETNNNNSKNAAITAAQSQNQGQRAVAAAADSSDSMMNNSGANKANKSPDSYNNRTTPETSTTSFGHPPTPQSYNSAPSPYQNHAEGNNSFSPSTQGYQPQNYQQGQIKNERTSPGLGAAQPYGGGYMSQHMYSASDQQYFLDQQQQQLGYPQDYPVHKVPHGSASFRYHPYGYERSAQVSSSSPAYPPQNTQPTPSPSPKQCDKCGCVCESAAQLLDHLNNAHPPTPSPHQHQQQQHPHMQFNQPSTPSHLQQQQFNFGAGLDGGTKQPNEIKTESDEPQSEILDLDSHKVHHVFQSAEEEEELKRNGDMSHGNPHSVSAMLGTWPGTGSPKMYSGVAGAVPGLFPPDQKPMYQHPLQMSTGEYMVHGVSTNSQEQMMSQYRPFEHLPPQPQPAVISSTQLGGGGGGPGSGGPPSKGTNWKSNEARRPKTYNCSACNKWFTSSGHLKRHYNTTLHKNAVKSSGQPDPAVMPISAHHHPGREERNSGGRGGHSLPDSQNHSPDSAAEEARGEDSSLSPAYDRTGGGALLAQPPAGPYDRLAMGPGPPLHSPMSGSPGLTNLSSASPPNGEAGPSATHQDHLSRGLLSISTVPSSHLTNSSSSGSQETPLSLQQQQQQQQAGFSLFSHTAGPGAGPPHMMVGGSPPADTTSLTAMHHHHMQQMQQQQQSPHLQMAASYPNASAPHVTPITATSSQPQATTSLTITGDQQHAYEQLYVLQQQQMAVLASPAGDNTSNDQHAAPLSPEYEQQPLPSFAQFQTAHHRYGILLGSYHQAQALHAANVGGSGPATDPIYLQPQPINLNHQQQQQQQQQQVQEQLASALYMRHQPSPTEDYEITVLENAAVDPLSHSPFSPQNMMTELPASPQDTGMSLAVTVKSEPKNDYEHGSPQISSTGSPVGPGAGHKTTISTGNNTLQTGAMPNGQHKCFDCDKVFNKACYLTQHNKTFHSGDKPFKCNRCGKRFPSDQIYQEHLAKHAGDKPYKCDLCPKQFNHKTDLRRHMCLHTGQKPYACEHCGKGFIRKDHMLKHAETHTRKANHHAHHHKQQVAAL